MTTAHRNLFYGIDIHLLHKNDTIKMIKYMKITLEISNQYNYIHIWFRKRRENQITLLSTQKDILGTLNFLLFSLCL